VSDQPTTPPEGPIRSWFGKLDPQVRAIIVLVLSAAFTMAWNKFLPGIPAPPIPSPVVVVNTAPADAPK
jgi:hypothetical protein